MIKTYEKEGVFYAEIEGEIIKQEDALEKLENTAAKKIILKINSCGGDFIFARDFYFALINKNAKKIAEVDAACSSAAVLMAGCDKIKMSPASFVMIHGITMYDGINENNAENIIETINSFNDVIANIYAKQTKEKTDAKQFRAYMEKESVFDFRKMEELGFPVEYMDNLSLFNRNEKFVFNRYTVRNNGIKKKILMKRFLEMVKK